jgi:flavin-dependent dehydrogenase
MQDPMAANTINSNPLTLNDGSKIGVVGGGPAGSFFSYFFIDMAKRIDLRIDLDIYEPKDYNKPGPLGCNMCGGIISESLVQTLATEGINLPSSVVQRGIDAYVLHTDVGTVRVETPLQEKRIAAVHRGAGPKKAPPGLYQGFDAFLLSQAENKGARIINESVIEVLWEDGRPKVICRDGQSKVYDLLVVATGANDTAARLFPPEISSYRPPRTVKTAIREFHMGEENILKLLGNAIQLYLMDIPNLKFAAIIPKGHSASLCMMGKNINQTMVKSFIQFPEVERYLPPQDTSFFQACACAPRMVVSMATKPFADRVVIIGDSAISRLYKDGIGAAYRTAKAAATTALFKGISVENWQRHFWPICKSINTDNQFGHIIFFVINWIQRIKFAQRVILNRVLHEQNSSAGAKIMSSVLWDTFTGSAAYRSIFLRTLRPGFLWGLVRSVFTTLIDIAKSLFEIQKQTDISSGRNL